MSIVTELAVTVVGGVLTAAVLALFAGGGRRSRPRAAVAVPEPPARRRGSLFGDLFRLVFAVAGGIAIAILGGRILIQAGVLPQGLGTRLGLLVAGTVFCWIVVASGRR